MALNLRGKGLFGAGAFGAAGGDPRNPRIMGMGTLPGGSYETIEFSGAGTITGDVSARSLRIAGSASVQGNATVGTISIAGAGRIAGDVEADVFDGSGSPVIDGTLTAKKVTVGGLLGSGASVTADEVVVGGAFQVAQALTARLIDVKLNGNANARQMRATDITVRLDPDASRDSVLAAEVIEGQSVVLEATRAQVVRGATVTVGRGCEIDLVEYSQDLEVHAEASVARTTKTDGGSVPEP